MERDMDLKLPGGHTRSLDTLPGPKGLPVVGNLLQLDMKGQRMHQVLEAWSQAFGPLYRLTLMNRRVLVVSDAELIHRVLRDRPQAYRRLSAIEQVAEEVGVNGVFSAEGEPWRRQRRPVVQALDARHLRGFFPTLVDVTTRLQRRWARAAAQQQAVDVLTDLMRYTVDVTTTLAFGYDMNTLEREGEVIQQHLQRVLPTINRRIEAPFPYWRYFRLPADRSFDRAVAAIRQTINEFIADARRRLAASPALAANPTNFLEAMLVAQTDGDASLSDDELFANVFTMLIAGEDTTASTIAWILHFLCEHPHVQRRIQEEADTVLGDPGVLAEMRDAARLVYIDAVAHESMRLKPIAPVFYVEANHDTDVGDVRVPAGTPVLLLTRVAALTDSFGADSLEFNPDRWLSGQPPSAQLRGGFVPFGSGPRLCPGRSLALLEMKAVISMVCRHFDVAALPGSAPVEEAFGFTMVPSGLRVRFTPREQRGAAPPL
jgi:cytochrome P450